MSVQEKADLVGQGHVFKYFDQLSPEDQKTLTEDVGALPLDDLANMFKGMHFSYYIIYFSTSIFNLTEITKIAECHRNKRKT